MTRYLMPALLLFAVTVVADDAPPARAKALQQFDTNGDGKLDEGEREAAKKAALERLGGREGIMKKFDTDGDGKLSQEERRKMVAELRQGAANKGRRPNDRAPAKPAAGGRPDRAALIKQFDADGDGQLNQEEKAKAMQAMRARFQGQGAGTDRAALIKKFDANGDGKLDEQERAKLRAALPQLMRDRKPGQGKPGQAPPDRAALMKKFDANGDGKLDEQERAKLRKASPQFQKPSAKPANAAALLDQLPPQAKQRLLAQFDANKNGQLEPPELAKAMQMMRDRGGRGRGPGGLAPGKQPKPTLDRAKLLEKYDADGDGKLSGDECAKAVKELPAKK